MKYPDWIERAAADAALNATDHDSACRIIAKHAPEPIYKRERGKSIAVELINERFPQVRELVAAAREALDANDAMERSNKAGLNIFSRDFVRPWDKVEAASTRLRRALQPFEEGQ